MISEEESVSEKASGELGALGVSTHGPRGRDVMVEGVDAIRGRKVPSIIAACIVALAVLGVLAADLVGQASAADIEERLEHLRTRWLSVYASRSLLDPEVNYDSELALLPFVNSGGVIWRIREATVRSRTGSPMDATVIAASPGAIEAMGAFVSEGRAFDQGHDSRGDLVALIGPGLANRIGISARPGAAIEIDGEHFTVIGVVGDVATATDALLGVIIPTRTAMRRWPPSSASPAELLVEVERGTSALASEAIPVHLRPTNPSSLTVSSALEPDDLISDVTAQLRRLLWWAALVLSLVGASTIAAQLTGAVHHRRGEIGLRRALGASHTHVLGQFLAEGAIVAVFGAAIGTALGGVLAIALTVAGAEVGFVPWHALLIPGAAATGVVAALLPARRAATQDPVAALRSG